MNHDALQKTYEIEFKLKNNTIEKYVIDKNTQPKDVTKAIADKYDFTEYLEHLEVVRVSDIPGESKNLEEHLDEELKLLNAKLNWDKNLGGITYHFFVGVKNGTPLEAATRWREIIVWRSRREEDLIREWMASNPNH